MYTLTVSTKIEFRRKLIELSPSRRDALDRVRHFEQLTSGQAYSGSITEGRICYHKTFLIAKQSWCLVKLMLYSWLNFLIIPATINDFNTFIVESVLQGVESDTCKCPFDPIDIDYITSISFNYGLSLMDMNQVLKIVFMAHSNAILMLKATFIVTVLPFYTAKRSIPFRLIWQKSLSQRRWVSYHMHQSSYLHGRRGCRYGRQSFTILAMLNL